MMSLTCLFPDFKYDKVTQVNDISSKLVQCIARCGKLSISTRCSYGRAASPSAPAVS